MTSQSQSYYSQHSLPPMASPPSKRVKTARKRQVKALRTRTLAPPKAFFGRQPFPKQLFNTVKYAELISSNLVAGLLTRVFCTNGLFDPYTTGTGRQPLYFDQLTAVYDHYTVLRSRAKFTWAGNVTTPILFSCYIEDDAATVANAADAMDRIGVQTKFVVPSYGATECTLYSKWSALEAFGPGTQADTSMQGSVTANPTENQFFVFQAYEAFAGVSTVSQLSVEIEYDVVWDEFVTVQPSS